MRLTPVRKTVISGVKDPKNEVTARQIARFLSDAGLKGIKVSDDQDGSGFRAVVREPKQHTVNWDSLNGDLVRHVRLRPIQTRLDGGLLSIALNPVEVEPSADRL